MLTRLSRRGCGFDFIESIVYSEDMQKTTPVWRPLFPHNLRPEARRAAAEYDIGPGEFANLCTRYVLDRLGKLPEAFALDEIERTITDGWDLEHSSLEQAITNRVSLPTHELTCPLCGAVEPDVEALLLHQCDLKAWKRGRHG